MPTPLPQLPRRNISTTSLSNGASPTGSQVTIKMCAFSHSIKEHTSLHTSDCEREREIWRAREARRVRNHPVCRFVGRRVEGSRRGVGRFSRALGQGVKGVEERARRLLTKRGGE